VYGSGAVGVFGNGSNVGVFGIGTTSDFYAGGTGVYGSKSSIRWKSNICVIENPLEKIMNLRGVYYDWDAEHGGNRDLGMIAEEVCVFFCGVIAFGCMRAYGSFGFLRGSGIFGLGKFYRHTGRLI
jgi:hypothetical protein